MTMRFFTLLAALAVTLALVPETRALDCTSTTSGDFDTVTWNCGVIPDANDTAIIGTGTEVTLDTNRDILGLVIESGATFNQSFWVLTSVQSGDSFFSNSGTYNGGSGTFVFAENGGVYGTSATTFRRVQIEGGVDFSAFGSPRATVQTAFTIAAGGFIRDADGGATPPLYGSFCTLTYNTGGSYDRSAEWTPSLSPGSVSVNNGTTLRLGTPGGTLTAPQGLTVGGTVDMQAMASPLEARSVFIGSAGSLILSSSIGGDLNLETGFSNNGTFTANNRAVTFDGVTASITGSQPIAFDFLTIDTPSGTTIQNDVSVDDVFTLSSGRVRTVGTSTFTTSAPSGLAGTTTSATVTGDAGWRLLSVPAASASTSEIADDGVAIRTGSATTSSILTGWDGSAFETPASLPATLSGGEGFYLYFYNTGSGTLPITLDFDGTAPTVADDPIVSDLNRGAGDEGWTMLGNPFRNAFDINRLVGVEGYAPQAGQIWTDGTGTNAEGSFVSTTTLGDQIPVWQGVWINVPNTTGVDAPTGAIFPDLAQVDGAGSFQSKTITSVPYAQLVLTGEDAASGATTRDEAALAVFTPAGTDAWDSRDMGKLLPPSTTYALLAFATEHEIDGETATYLKAQDSRGLETPEAYALPVEFLAAGVSGRFTIESVLNDIPSGWDVVLQDRVTGDWTDLRSGSYAFDATTTAGAKTAGTTPSAGVLQSDETRFVLHIGPDAITVATDDAPLARTRLGAVSPNPARGTARATLTLDAPERVRADVLDALGRVVRTVLDAELAAGASHTLDVRLDGLASGVYVLRVEGETFAESRRLTVIR